ncbi:MAG: sphingomyelin phosphodiesterase [Gammaproteobacteria bacterium]
MTRRELAGNNLGAAYSRVGKSRRLSAHLAVLCTALMCIHGAMADGTIERSHYLSNSFNVLAYNIFMRPRTLFHNDQSDRAAVLPSKLRGFDAIVFSEAFDDGVRGDLLKALRAEYPWQTKVLGSDRVFEQDGGVVIVSRWPITHVAERRFRDVCTGSDCKADKGVLYARIRKHGRTFHVFGSHTQAGDGGTHRDKRAQQFRIIKRFIDDLRLAHWEPVFVAGDLNVDRYSGSEYRTMLETLDASFPRPLGHPYTVDSTTNDRSNGRSYLDYVLVSMRHAQPIEALIETLRPRSPRPFGGDYDLSDHYPVFGHFMFPTPASTIVATGG